MAAEGYLKHAVSLSGEVAIWKTGFPFSVRTNAHRNTYAGARL